MQAHLDGFATWKRERSATEVEKALDHLTRTAEDPSGNLFGAIVDGARANLTHGEICDRLRRDLGFGQPLTIV
jgi:methylmalonyl-CoA mutase N-terminal domain/subunit